MNYVYLNGDILPREKAVISVNDRAILFGDGAYETMRSYAGKFFRFPEHLRRLRSTLAGMELVLDVPDADIIRGAKDLVEANQTPDARVRLTVTGGLDDGEIRLRRSHPANLIMNARPLVPPPDEIYRTGVAVAVSPWRVHADSPLPRIKTINRLMHLMAKEVALAREAWDSLFCDPEGAILEGTATNVFFVIDGTLRTPALEGPLLAGVTRDAVLEAAKAAGIPTREDRIPVKEAVTATEAFLTSTTIELLPIRELDDAAIGDPGTVWRTLAMRYREMVAEETGVSQPPVP